METKAIIIFFVYRTSPSVSGNCRSLAIDVSSVSYYFFFAFTADQNNYSTCPVRMDLVQENIMADDSKLREKSLDKLDCSEQEAENTNESSSEDSWQGTYQTRCDDSEIFQGTNVNISLDVYASPLKYVASTKSSSSRHSQTPFSSR